MSENKELMEEGISALNKQIDQILKDDSYPLKNRLKFAKKAENALRILREGVDEL